MKKVTIYKRMYDNPFNPDGSDKEKEVLGVFNIIETIEEDSYSGLWIGENDGVVYLIKEIEVSGHNGGSRCEIKVLSSLKLR